MDLATFIKSLPCASLSTCTQSLCTLAQLFEYLRGELPYTTPPVSWTKTLPQLRMYLKLSDSDPNWQGIVIKATLSDALVRWTYPVSLRKCCGGIPPIGELLRF